MRPAARNLFVIGMLALALSTAACGNNGSDTGNGGNALDGADSPEALLELARPFAELNDLGGMIGLIAPGDRHTVAFSGLMLAETMPKMAQMLIAFNQDPARREAAEAKLKGLTDGFAAVFEKYEVDTDKFAGPDFRALMSSPKEPGPGDVCALMEEHFPKLDPGPFMSDLIAVINEHGEKKQAEELTKRYRGELENLEIDGDRAAGTVNGKSVVFVRENGRWYFSISQSRK